MNKLRATPFPLGRVLLVSSTGVFDEDYSIALKF